MSSDDDVVLASAAFAILANQRRPSLQARSVHSGSDVLNDLHEDEFNPLSGRRANQEAKKNAKSGSTKFPDLKDHEAVQMFFLQEVQLGEELLSMGEEEAGVEHLSNAVAVCGQPNQLLQVLQQTLPQHVFQLLLMRLPTSGQRFMGSAAPTPASVVDDGPD